MHVEWKIQQKFIYVFSMFACNLVRFLFPIRLSYRKETYTLALSYYKCWRKCEQNINKTIIQRYKQSFPCYVQFFIYWKLSLSPATYGFSTMFPNTIFNSIAKNASVFHIGKKTIVLSSDFEIDGFITCIVHWRRKQT